MLLLMAIKYLSFLGFALANKYFKPIKRGIQNPKFITWSWQFTQVGLFSTQFHLLALSRACRRRQNWNFWGKKTEEIYQMVYTWRRGYATQSAVSLSRPFAFARTGAPRTPLSPLWWGWIRLEPTAVNTCANFFPSKNCAHICEKVCGNCFNPKFCRNNCAQIYAFLCNANFCEIFWENLCGK